LIIKNLGGLYLIKNFMCKSCDHLYVCKIHDKISVFSIDAKKPLGVDVKILGCKEYVGDGEVFDEEE